MALRTLVLGGARSGKSGHAEALLAATGSVTYVATARQDADDAEWADRIARHVMRRPDTWRTVEIGTAAELPALLANTAPADPSLLVDDLGAWLARVLDETDAWSGSAASLAAARALTADLQNAVAACATELVLVSAEVGLGVVPSTPAGRLFRDELGTLNAALAQSCTGAVLVVAGVPMTLRGSAPAAPRGEASPAARSAIAASTPIGGATVQTPVQTSPVQIPPVQAQPVQNPPEQTESSAGATNNGSSSDATAAGLTGTGAVGSAIPTEPALPGAGAEAGPPVVFASVIEPNEQARRQAVARQEQLTKPAGSLGRLEEIGVWITACQGTCPPRPFGAQRIVVFAGDHGVADRGVSAYPKEVTGQMVANFLHGGAAVNVLAAAAGATVRIVDMSVDGDTSELIATHKVRRGSGSIDREDALTQAEVNAALAAGKAIADEEIDGGADLLVAGDMGIANTTPAAVLIAALTGMEPVDVIGRGTGIDDEGWMRKATVIRDALRRARKVASDPVALLRTSGGADLAAMAGFLAQAAIRRTPVVLDGVVVGAAAMVAEELAPGAKQWWVAGHQSVEPAHKVVLSQLDLAPVLNLDMRLGEGSGAVAALPIIAAAVKILAQMATFAEAGVAGPDTPPPAA